MTPPSPSELIVQLDLKTAKIQSVMVGGNATVMRTLELDI